MQVTELLGHSGDFALFGDGKHDGLTVIVSTKTLDTFDPQPFAGIDPTRWEEPDEALAPTEAWELAEQVLANAKQVTGTDVIIAAGEADKRSFAIPKTVQAEAQKALDWRKQHKRGGTDVGMNTARTLAKGGSIGIQKVRHINRYFARHEVDKSGKGWSPGDDGYPSNGKIAWALWGGDAAWKWTNGILRREKDLAILAAADDAESPEPEAETEIEEPVSDEQSYDPDKVHPYLPEFELNYACRVCGGGETALLHSDDAFAEEAEPLAAAGTVVVDPGDIRPDRPKQTGDRKTHQLATAERFFAFDAKSDDGVDPEFYVEIDYRADGTPSMVTSIFVQLDESWMEWNPRTTAWDGAPEQSEVVPIDDESAYTVALLMEDGRSIPVREVNPPEWAMTDEARSAIPDYDAQAMESLDFCVVFGETDCDDCGDLAVTELWLKEGDGQCWRWNPVDVEWQVEQNCPNECTQVDADAAREIAMRLTKEAHPATTDGRNQGKFHQRPGGGDQAIGPHLNRPHGPVTQRPPNHSPSGFEFDSSFARAAWVARYARRHRGLHEADRHGDVVRVAG